MYDTEKNDNENVKNGESCTERGKGFRNKIHLRICRNDSYLSSIFT